MSRLKVYILSSTHWDREWYKAFQGFRYKLVKMTDKVLDTLESVPEFGQFTFDGQTIVLEDYLEAAPENQERLSALIRAGKILIGPWYVMPDELLVSGESLVRNLMTGCKIAESFGVQPWKYAYGCDIFGHAAQMPQIFNGFGIQYAFVGRGTNEHSMPAHALWQSPDGSQVIAYKQNDVGGYGHLSREIAKHGTSDAINDFLKGAVAYEIKRSPFPIVLLPDGVDHNDIHPELVELSKRMEEFFPGAEVVIGNLEDMGKELEPYRAQMQIWKGEMIETAVKEQFVITNCLSSRIDIKRINDQCQSMMEKWLLPVTLFAAFDGIKIRKSFEDIAYKYLLKNHPHDSICGCSIDDVHRDTLYRYNQVKEIADIVLEDVFADYKARISGAGEGYALSLYNPLPFERFETVSAEIHFDKEYANRFTEPFGREEINSFVLLDEKGEEVPYTITNIQRNANILFSRTDTHTIVFDARLAPCGMTQYKLLPIQDRRRYSGSLNTSVRSAENEWIALTIENDGSIALFDKRTNKQYANLLIYMDDGETGDGWGYVPPSENSCVLSAGAPCTIAQTLNSRHKCTFRITHFMKVPKEMLYSTEKTVHIRRSEELTELKITSSISITDSSSAVFVETVVDNTAYDHRLRLSLPTGMQTERYFANQAFCFVERSCGRNASTDNWCEPETVEKPMSGIVGKRAADGSGLAFVSAYGLHECAALADGAGTLNITLLRAFRNSIGPSHERDGQVQGEHRYSYCIVPMESKDTWGTLRKLQDCLAAGIKCFDTKCSNDFAPSSSSFMHISGSGDICCSMIKRPENGEENAIVIRLYNVSEQTQSAVLHFSKEIANAEKVNLNEEYQEVLSFENKQLTVTLPGNKIATYFIRFAL